MQDEEKRDCKVMKELYASVQFSVHSLPLAGALALQTDSSHRVQTKDLCLGFQE